MHSNHPHDTLACRGGRPLRRDPMPGWPHFGDDEVAAVAEVLRTARVNYWNGEQGRLFESEFAAAHGCRYGVAVANGTVALELALKSLGIEKGDEVVVPCRTFIATASCVVAVGAKPVLADVDPDSGNLTAETVEAVLTRRTKAVIAVHLAGWPCEMTPLQYLAAKHNLYLVEDCAQAHGATHRGQPVGSLGDAAAFSFCTDKILSTGGEGGMLTTRHRHIAERAWEYKDHGKGFQTVLEQAQQPTVFKWLHESFGTNWRLTEMQAAIGRVVLRKLNRWVEARRRHAEILYRELAGHPALRIEMPPGYLNSAFYKFYAYLRPEHLRDDWTRDEIVRAVQSEGIPCGSGICSEIYRERAFEKAALAPRSPLPVAHELGETSLMFAVHPTLSDADMLDTAAAVKKVLAVATHGGERAIDHAA